MLKYFKKRSRNKKIKKIEEGDRSLLKPMRFWQLFSRTVFHKSFTDQTGMRKEYSVDVEFYTGEQEVKLYIDKRQMATSSAPAVFPVLDGYIEVDVGTYGLKRMHFVHGDHEEVLRPDCQSAEGIRSKFHNHFPKVSQRIGRLAIIILLVSLALEVPQLIELLTQFDVVKERVGTFTSPIQLPKSLNTALLISSAFAALERALTLKNHWLIDLETTTFEDF